MRRAREIAIAAPMLAFVLLFVWGCASAAVTIIRVGPDYTAFGDSITIGGTLADPAVEAYPALVAAAERVSLSNYAIGGDQACDIAPRQIFAHAMPTVSSQRAIRYSVLIGTNDADNRGSGAYESVFIQCHQAVVAWLAVPPESKVIAGNRGFSAMGPGVLDTMSGWTAWTTQGQGSTASFTVSTAQAGALYAWVALDDASAATYTYSLDGEILGSAAAQLPPHIATVNGTTRSLGFLRLPGVPAGAHTIMFTQSNPGKDGVSVVAAGVPVAAASATLPIVLVGTVPLQLHTGEPFNCQSSDLPCQAYNVDITGDVGLLAGDGLDVRLFDTRQYLQPTEANMSDGVHPNAQGHKELSRAVESVWTAGR